MHAQPPKKELNVDNAFRKAIIVIFSDMTDLKRTLQYKITTKKNPHTQQRITVIRQPKNNSSLENNAIITINPFES